MIITFVILAITIVLFISQKLRSDIVALLSLLALFLAGILDSSQALSGFSDSTVIMIAALFVVGEGLSQTGVTTWLGQQVIALAGSSKGRLLVVLMVGTAVLSAFISNTGTVATLLPATVNAAWSIGSTPSMFLIPLAFAANTGGLLTLTGTPPNIVVADTLSNNGYAPFGYFEYAKIGLPLLICAVAYMVFIGQRLLPTREGDDKPINLGAEMKEVAQAYALQSKLFKIYVRENEQFVDKNLKQINIGHDFNVSVIKIEFAEEESPDDLSQRERRRARIRKNLDINTEDELPGPESMVRRHDTLLVKATDKAIQAASEHYQFAYEPANFSEEGLSAELLSHDVGVAEIILTPRSTYISRTVASSQIGQRYHVQVVTVLRGDKPISRKGTKLAYGDALLVRGSWQAIDLMRKEKRNFVVVGNPEAMSKQVVELSRPATIAVLAMVGMVGLMVSGWVPSVMAALIAAVAMVLGGCLSMPQAYRSISWQSVVLIAAMIPMSVALEVTGGATFIANGLVNTLGSYGPIAMMAGVFLLTTAFSQVINNTATAVLVAPIVLKAAEELAVSPYPLLMIVAVSASTAFLTPIGTTTNLMVMTPGGYRFNDYAKVGGPLLLIFLIVSLILVPIIWPF